MASSISSLYSFLVTSSSRKLLLRSPVHYATATATVFPISKPGQGDTMERAIDSSVTLILSILLCALVCLLGLISAIRCSMNCWNRIRNRAAPLAKLANTGLDQKALKTFPILTYSAALNLPECTICLLEFTPGQRFRVLPKCDHGFHHKCIDKWLVSHSSCPNCRQCLIDTCQKINGQSEPSASLPVVIAPLDREGLTISHTSVC